MVDALVAASAALAAATFIVGLAWKIAKPHFRALILDVAEAKKDAKKAAKELAPNGGDSCRDAIDALTAQVETNTRRLGELTVAEQVRDAEMEAIRAGVSYTGRALDNVARSLDRLERERNRNE